MSSHAEDRTFDICRKFRTGKAYAVPDLERTCDECVLSSRDHLRRDLPQDERDGEEQRGLRRSHARREARSSHTHGAPLKYPSVPWLVNASESESDRSDAEREEALLYYAAGLHEAAVILGSCAI